MRPRHKAAEYDFFEFIESYRSEGFNEAAA